MPAATDLIIGMGAGDHLIAVSNYDTGEIGTRQVPRVGDYQNTDWETLAQLRPHVMVIQMVKERLPAGFLQKAERLNISLVNVRFDSLDDILATTRRLGTEIGEPRKGEELSGKLAARVEALRKRNAGRKPVRTLLALDETGRALVGAGTYLDDLLRAAGGENAAASLPGMWPTADQEMLLTLKPDVVIVLNPGGKPAVLDKAKALWRSVPNAPAGAKGRVYLLNEPFVLLPGAHVADVAEAIARCISVSVADPAGEGKP